MCLCPSLSTQIWDNLNQTPAELFRKKTTGWFLLVTIAFLNTVPLFVLSILANLSSVCIVPFSERIFPHRIPEDCQLCAILRTLVSIIPSFLRHRLWCTSTCRVRTFWFRLAHHDAMDLQIPGCFDAIPFRPRSCGSVFCVLGNLTAGHIYPHRCWLQCVPNILVRFDKC